MEPPASRIEEMDFPLHRVSRSVPFFPAALSNISSEKSYTTFCSVPIYEGTTDSGVDGAGAREEGECSHVGSVEQDQSVLGIVQAIAGCGEQDADGQADSAISTGKMDPQSPGWTRRLRVGRAPPDRTPCASRKSALEKSIRGYAEKLGDEGKPTSENTKSCRCECPAMRRLLRTTDNGWYITEHRVKHNHTMTENCGEKVFWPSHKHIDVYTRDLVRQLRENNINIGKVYIIIAAFFGNEGNMLFTKRSLQNLCGKLSKEQADDDVRKTIEAFDELGAKDPEFMFRVQADDEGRIKNLMWTTGASRMQYKCFGDAITFDTTYKMNLYDMAFGLFVGVNNHFQSIIFAGVVV
ncbi:hypothetical protein ACQ4PT_022259 [Festuca glaucescens]